MDWIASDLSLIGWYLIPKRKILAMCIFLCVNVAWIVWSLSNSVYSLFLLQVCFVVLNIRTIKEWSEED